MRGIVSLTSSFVDARFQGVAEQFQKIADSGDPAQFTAYVGGKLVVDLACGMQPDELTVVYSVTKALTAMTMAKLVDLNLLDLNQTVAHYWPEFAASGKQNITVRQLLSHQAGLPETRAGLRPEQLMDGRAAADLLAAEMPLWHPGHGFGYHSLSIGPLAGELCRRVTGNTIQEYYEAELRKPAGAHAFIGIQPEFESKVVDLLPQLPLPGSDEPIARMNPLEEHVSRDVPATFISSLEGMRAGLASASGVASARGLTALFQWATGYGQGDSGISAQTLEAFAQTQVFGPDWVSGANPRSHGVLFMKATTAIPFGSYRAFGHDGYSGGIVVADPVGEIVYAYVPQRVPNPAGMDRRAQPIIDALRKAALS